jgi:hypothetical protein
VSPGVLRLALGLFLCRALIPVGFMPAPLDSGAPFMICHGGPAGAFFEALAAHRAVAGIPEHTNHHVADTSGHMPEHTGSHQHDNAPDTGDDPSQAQDGWEHCPLGVAAGAAALAHDAALHLLSLDHDLAAAEPAGAYAAPFFSSYQARAPPIADSHRLT